MTAIVNSLVQLGGERMKFESYKLVGGRCELGYEEGWHWSKKNGHYHRHQDFFWVHWEINDAKPHDVKLHVESPKAEIDVELNRIKQEMIAAFLTPRFKFLVEEHGYGYSVGRRAGIDQIQRNKSTEPFRVILTDAQCQSTHQANIEMVNALMRQSVSETIERFAPQLSRYFAP